MGSVRAMQRLRRLTAPASIIVGAVLLRLAIPVGFANYDTLYSLVWGQQLERGHTPIYDVPVAPTPHPLAEIVGFLLAPLGVSATLWIVLAIAYLALAALPYFVYRLGAAWFSRPVGLAAAALIIPYTVLVLAALLIETRRRRAGWPVLVLLDLAGLLRPEAWLFAGVYWLYLVPRRTRRELAWLAALVAAPALAWVLSDLAITGNALWSLSHTRTTATQLHRPTGLLKFPYTGARRLGEVLGPDGLIAAAIGGVLSVWLLRSRSWLGLIAGIVAFVAFAIVASSGLPIDDRYTFVPVALLAIFGGAGLFGWQLLPREHPRRRLWGCASIAIVIAIVGFAAWNVHRIRQTFDSTVPREQGLSAQLRIQNDLVALVKRGSISLRCGLIGVPYHTPVPLLALRLDTSPANIVTRTISRGTFIKAANAGVLRTYLLDPNDPSRTAAVPAGFRLTASNRSWEVYKRCA
jgi:MFS family permease